MSILVDVAAAPRNLGASHAEIDFAAIFVLLAGVVAVLAWAALRFRGRR